MTKALVLAAGMVVVIAMPACSDSNDKGDSAAPPSSSKESVVQVWRLAATPDATSKTLDIAYASGGCIEFDRAEVDETAEVVTVTVYTREPSAPPDAPDGAPVACTSDFGLGRTQALLAEPLGNRKVEGMCDIEAAAAKTPNEQSVAEKYCVMVDQLLNMPAGPS